MGLSLGLGLVRRRKGGDKLGAVCWDGEAE